MTKEIRIKVVGVDQNDGYIKYEIYFNNGFCAVTLEFYGYPDEFKEFSIQLIDFPKTASDKAIYELGEKGNQWAYHLLIQAYCVESNGRSAIKVESTNNGVGPGFHDCKFEIESEVASINRLGTGLKNWNPLDQEQFVWRPN